MALPYSTGGPGGGLGPQSIGESKPGSRKFYLKRFDMLRKQREPFLKQWLQLAEFVLPWTGRFRGVLQHMGTPNRSNYSLLNSVGTDSLDALKALLVTGITPPAKPWLRFRVGDPGMAAIAENKRWTDMAENAFFSVLNASNFYSVIPSVYEEVALYGTSAMEIVPHPEKLVSFQQLTAGQYVLANDAMGMVNTVFYEDLMTVMQMYEEFVIPAENRDAAEAKLSQRVRECWRKGEVDERFVVIKGIFPNDENEETLFESIGPNATHNMPFKGVAFEPDAPGSVGDSSTEILQKSFYQYMPILCPRWHVNPGEPYGRGPGGLALGDIKMLQELERSKMSIIEKLAHPPLVASTDSIEGRINMNAGEITYLPMTGGPVGDMVKPLVDMRTRAAELEGTIYRVEERIRKAFHNDLVNTIRDLRPPPGLPGQSRNITATEVDANQQERFLKLAPIMGRFDYDLLDSMTTQIISMMIAEERIPPPPEEMMGAEVKIEFLNIVSAAQRSAAAQGAIDLYNFVTNPLIAEHPKFRHLALKLRDAEAIEAIAEGMDVPADAALSLNEFREAVEQVMQQEAEQQQMQQAAQLAEMAKSVGQTPGADGKPMTQNLVEELEGRRQ